MCKDEIWQCVFSTYGQHSPPSNVGAAESEVRVQLIDLKGPTCASDRLR